ncbi:hypothetical protein ACWT_2115 [Actinoplanes sp. SE50]|nr:hypothetical protein ACPL_2239 [Actinoplanes sp. SE50/110]ATO81530.1 hypothetical protein ACWT_2115 [Actinoplanes sp. SE50]SLL98937.1 hypothetical protein ACSP50_2164 [Actinoplanes sp. SE50/110]
MGKVTGKIPVPVVGDLANNYVNDLLTQAQQRDMVDNHGHAVFKVADALGAARNTSAHLTEQSLYNSGKLHDLPDSLIVDGHPKPRETWTHNDFQDWQEYKNGRGQSVVGIAADHGADAYQNGWTWARTILGGSDGTE